MQELSRYISERCGQLTMASIIATYKFSLNVTALESRHAVQ